MRHRPTAFSWGYWGWGTHTTDFVRAVDAIERKRGKRPPIFVDIRYSRAGRAPGFVGDVFQQTVGRRRYRWLRKLGNKTIGKKKAARIIDRSSILADLSGIEDMRQLILDAQRQRRRVIFFCACERPCNCHRSIVADLLRRAAARKRTPIDVIEWPGGEPRTVRLAVSARVIRGILRGMSRIPLNNVRPSLLRDLQALPWCSRVELRCDKESLGVIAGPAHLAGTWYLSVIGPKISRQTDTAKSLFGVATQLRRSLGYSADGAVR